MFMLAHTHDAQSEAHTNTHTQMPVQMHTHITLKKTPADSLCVYNTHTHTHTNTYHCLSLQHCVGRPVSSSVASTAASPAPFANVFCLSVQTPLTHSPAGGTVNRAAGSGPCHL